MSLNSFTILIIISILFDPSLRCVLLSEKRCHSLFIRLFTEPIERKSILKRCKLFSNDSLKKKCIVFFIAVSSSLWTSRSWYFIVWLIRSLF